MNRDNKMVLEVESRSCNEDWQELQWLRSAHS